MTQLQLIMALLEGYDDKVHHLKDGTTIRYLKDTGKVRYFEKPRRQARAHGPG
jgi:hypothetical protein